VSLSNVDLETLVSKAPTGHAFADYLSAWSIAPIVTGPVDFSLIVAATPAAHSVAQTSAAAAPAVESTTPIRLLHFVRDVRRLAISGFLYHSQF